MPVGNDGIKNLMWLEVPARTARCTSSTTAALLSPRLQVGPVAGHLRGRWADAGRRTAGEGV
ncbi:hypothetical protein LV779_27995 [Streptomyces thinghirensis]|nr:hypothetical protein [Streptomyces thinghirensis]